MKQEELLKKAKKEHCEIMMMCDKNNKLIEKDVLKNHKGKEKLAMQKRAKEEEIKELIC